MIVNKFFNRDGPEIIYCTERREFLGDGNISKKLFKIYMQERQITDELRKQDNFKEDIVPLMREKVTNYIANCETCKRSKNDCNPPRIEIMLMDSSKKSLGKIHLDISTLENTKRL
ncbi:hypothetical protein HHI36_012835 [Cryptolaemus montrouzieri]|uniref:Uncharacterized protein n=1 Tax=Cryptolaemus montrouzieri TaxID=559131 RepID=A0ABD2NG84_9CUCU